MENRTSFGLDARSYRDFRPVYPESIYRYLAALCESRIAALDCATGNGQAATALAARFDRVVATDTDAAQIDSAQPHARVEYRVIPAEALPEDLGRFDLVTVAQGAHWFDLPAFYACLQRLLRPGAVVAIWGYSFGRTATAIDALLEEELEAAVDAYWAQGNRVIMDHYRSIPFPYTELAAPKFAIKQQWTRAEFFGFVRTWSAYKRLLAAGSPDPLIELDQRLDAESLWLPGSVCSVEFELHTRVGRSGA